MDENTIGIIGLAWLFATFYGLRLRKRGQRKKGFWVILGALILMLSVIGATAPPLDTDQTSATPIAATASDKDRTARTIAKFGDDLTLEGYAKLSQKKRAELIVAHLAAVDIDPGMAPKFVACMGDLAWQKSKDLPVSKVFGWCKGEYERGDAAFLEHVDELSAKDLSSQATVICRGLVRDQLTAPGAADFPWIPEFSIRMPRQKYRIKSYVDAENALGGEVRMRYFCEVQHNQGDPLTRASWTVQSFEMSGT